MRTRSRSLIVPFATVALIALAACGDDMEEADEPDATSAAAAVEVDGKTYVADGEEGIELPAGSTLRIAFADGNVSVTGGCNTMNGAYDINDNVLTVEGMAATQMACDEALMTLDTAVSDLLSSGPTLAVDGETLTITSGDTSLTLSEEQPLPLEGTAWTVTGLIDADAVTSYAVQPTLAFAGDTVAVFAGCNSGSGGVTITETTIEFGPIALTRMACEGDATTVENFVVTVLTGVTDYTIEGSTLTIMNGDQGLVATGTPSE